jgi:hypothetical protein
VQDSLLDIVGSAHRQPTCLVVPTLSHALVKWTTMGHIYRDHHNGAPFTSTKTAFQCRTHYGLLRLWCPYEREPTMPLDWAVYRRGFKLMSTYYTEEELRRWL